MTERDYFIPLVMASIALMILAMLIAVAAGPTYCHYFNLVALTFTLIALVILKRNFSSYGLTAKIALTLLLFINVSLGVFLICIKYGYFNREYLNPFQIE